MLKKNAHPDRDERDARGTTLIPACPALVAGPVPERVPKQALSRVRPCGLYSHSGNGERLRLSYLVVRNSISPYVFKLRLREDFQPIWLARLSPHPGSLPAWTDLLVPIIAFADFVVLYTLLLCWASAVHISLRAVLSGAAFVAA